MRRRNEGSRQLIDNTWPPVPNGDLLNARASVLGDLLEAVGGPAAGAQRLGLSDQRGWVGARLGRNHLHVFRVPAQLLLALGQLLR